ncbi:MAG: hypothetical protein KDA96_25090, partial [Planctomycetaceae bacterium]|nr:hypothetical protein [Planctomycetaceae bacterium]
DLTGFGGGQVDGTTATPEGGLSSLAKLPHLESLWLSNCHFGGQYQELSELKSLQTLTMMMCDVTTSELESLEKALPNTRISHMTGGGGWVSGNASGFGPLAVGVIAGNGLQMVNTVKPFKQHSGSTTANKSLEEVLLATSELVADRAPLHDVIRQLAEKHGIKIDLDADGMKAVGVTRNIPITMEAKGVRLRSLLTLILDDYGLTWEVRDNERVVIIAKQQPEGANSASTGMRHELLKMLTINGKVETDQINAAITLVAAAGAQDATFAKRLLAEFDKCCREGSRAVGSRRNLIAVFTKMFESWAANRWRQQLSALNPDDLPQIEAGSAHSIAPLEESILQTVMEQGYSADRHEIASFTMAVRQLHHENAKPFLLDVLNNPSNNTGKWADNIGSSWVDAKFVAAVGLAELGEAAGVDWLLKTAEPNDFGIDESLFRYRHIHDQSSSLRASSRRALIDLFHLQSDATHSQLSIHWSTRTGEFPAGPVLLRGD